MYLNRLLFLPLVFCSSFAIAQTSVLTQHNDLYRTGINSHETILNLKNVNRQQFGKIFSRSVDEQIWGQPLIVSGLSINNSVHNVVFVTTANNSVYAFDADSANLPAPFWQVNLTASGKRAVLYSDMTGACNGNYNNFLSHIGIVGTPVIDTGSNTIYVVARSVNVSGGTGYVQYLHALDILTGNERPNSPVLITAQVTGTGDGAVAGQLSFDPQKGNQRPGLLLLNGIIYIGFSSHCDWGPYHGWLLGYDATTLQQKSIYISTPYGSDGGIWMSGMAPAADENGAIYIATGNGTTDGLENNPGPVNTGTSIMKLVPSGNQLNVESYFTPSNFDYLNNNDLDVGVVQVLLIPKTNLAVSGDKNGELFVLNRDTMGGFNQSSNMIIQRLGLSANSNLHASLAYYPGSSGEWMYVWSENTGLTAYPFDRINKLFNSGAVVTGPYGPYGQSGAFLSVSSNGSDDSTAILWASYAATGDAESTVDPGILRAFSATDINREIWNSSMDPNDQPGNYAKFVCPTVANGKVYLATFSNQLAVYGLTDKAKDTCNTSNVALNKPSFSSSLENNTFNSSAAFDGNLATRWSSQFSDPQYIEVDLGQEYQICQVVLLWEAAYGKDFSIQVSDDDSKWTIAQTVFGNTERTSVLSMNVKGRYIRMLGTARGTVYGYSLYEFQVFGKPTVIASTGVKPVVFPNPVQAVVHVLKGNEDILDVAIIDVSGRILMHIQNLNNDPQVDLPTSNLAKAIYFVRVRTTGKSYQYKILHIN